MWLRRLRRLLDPWSVPHFLFGSVTALAAIAFEWPLLIALLATVIAAVLWEYFERRIGLREARGNPYMDILLPILAFGITLLLVDQQPLHQEQHIGLFFSVMLLFAFVNVAAWRARIEKDHEFLG